jgi:NADH-ubiquinone oxidoreductase chain 5
MLKILPVTYMSILIGSLSLTGFPFLTGFYSKEVILEVAFVKFSINSIFIYWLGVLAAFITSFYSIRLIYLVFFSSANSNGRIAATSQESNSFVFCVLSTLSVVSIFIGFVFKDLFVGLGTDFFGHSIFQSYENCDILYAEFLVYYCKLIPVAVSITASLVSLLVYFIYYNTAVSASMGRFFSVVYVFLVKKWFFDLVYNNLFVFTLLEFFYSMTFKVIDRGFVELFGPLSIVRYVNSSSIVLSSFQTGYIYSYIFVMLLGLIFFFKSVMLLSMVGLFYYSINFKLLICFMCIILFLAADFRIQVVK